MNWNFKNDDTILIWGAGAIGGAFGAAFANSGYKVLFVDIDKEHVNAINSSGISLEGPVKFLNVQARACLPEDLEGTFKLVFLAVKAHHTESAVKRILPHLAEDGVIVSAQNGLNERTIAAFAGAGRTMGCFVNLSGEYLAPGRINYGLRGALVVGELDGGTGERAHFVHGLLKEFDDAAVLSANIWGYLWSKMIYGTMLYATALTGAPIWENLAHEKYRDVFIALGREIAGIAKAGGVVLEPFDGFEPAAFSPDASMDEARVSMQGMVGHNKKNPDRRSGIWRDLVVRKRKTEVDGQLPPILDVASKYGLSAPLTAELIRLIHECENGLPLGWENLDTLYRAAK